MCEAKSCDDFISGSSDFVAVLLPEDQRARFAEEVCEQWELIAGTPSLSEADDRGTAYSCRLRNLLRVTNGTLKQVLAGVFVTSPHSMSTERAVSHYNQIKSDHRQGLLKETVNQRLIIALNGKGTAHFDPRPSVAAFLRRKERRYRVPMCAIYKNREFVRKIFRESSTL